MSSNDHEKRITRRYFLRMGAAGMAALGLGMFTEEGSPADPAWKLPRRRYGRTGLEIGAIVGASDWNPAVIPTAVAAGVNYWHKAQAWADTGLPDALRQLPRESYILECVVDRIGGHMRGRIDEEAHYQFVRECVRRSGVRYYDVMKFHFGYHSVAEAKTDMGVVRAFRRLKREGLVHHLALSQHDYNIPGIGGDRAVDILATLIENSPYEAGQFFYTYGDGKEKEDLLALARRKRFGTIAMKTMAGVGRASRDPQFLGQRPGAAMVKWLMSNRNLTASVIAIANFPHLQENLSAATRSAMTPDDRESLRLLAAYNKGLTCLLCAECVSHCPEQIAIADILRYERYAHDYQQLERARAEYASLNHNGTACANCGSCLPVCPVEIDIAKKLQEVHRVLG